jgi:hypothetical protein
MTRAQRKLIAEYGPYTIGRSGCLLNRERHLIGEFFSASNTWNRAVVAALNAIVREEKKRGGK